MTRGRYRIVAFGQQVGIGVAGSYWATIGAVAKCNGPNAPYCIPNEWIARKSAVSSVCRFRPPGLSMHLRRTRRSGSPRWIST